MHKVHRLGLRIEKSGYFRRKRESLSVDYKNGKAISCKEIWAKEVKYRDDNICQVCKLKDPRIVIAHHVKEATLFPELKFVLSNGVTLCPNCHALTHYYNGRDLSGKRLSTEEIKLVIKLNSVNTPKDQIATALRINRKTVEYHISSLGVQ